MLRKIIGWLAVFIATAALLPSVIPGAISAIGFALALTALGIALIPLKSGTGFYFNLVTAIYGFGILVVNDGLRVIDPLPEAPLAYKLAAYFIFALAVAFSLFIKVKMRIKKC
jgi:hypothetical protein